MEEVYQIQQVISLVMQRGIRTYKFKNSKLRSFTQEPEGTKGAIFGFRTKESMIDSRGFVLTSEEALAENEGLLSHWTPNTYCYGTYADSGKTIVKGHLETNLRQINTFVIDFDKVAGEELTAAMILDAATELELYPTLILKTPRGYQAYFVLQKPWFVSPENDYASIEKVAKRVSINLRKAFSDVVPGVDHKCNHFGIFRIPRRDNIVFFFPGLTHDMQRLIKWSMDYQPVSNRPNLRVLPEETEIKQVNEKWVDILLKNPEIVGSKGVMGRNNAIFTLSLAHYASGVEQDRCRNLMDEFNSDLKHSIPDREVEKIVSSAYSGRYRGATKEKVLELLANWSVEAFSVDQLFSQQRTHWYKFKKARSERKQSHIHEWKKDILDYLEKECYRYRPEIELKKADLQAAIVYKGGAKDKMIPKRSLDRALKELQDEGKLYLKVRAGRGGGLTVATRKALIRTMIVVKQQVKGAYKKYIRTFFEEAAILTKMFETSTEAEQTGLFGVQTNLWDTG